MNKVFISISLIIFMAFSGVGQNSYTEKFYIDFVSGDMESWQKNLQYLKADYKKKPTTETLLEIVKAQYGLIAYFIGIEEKQKASKELDIAQKNIDLLLKQLPENKNLLAWKGAFYGFELGIAPWKVLYYGPQSQEFITQALTETNNYPESNFEYANMLFWAPAIVGGNKQESITYYKKTIAILESRQKTREWYYLWVLTAYSHALKEVYGIEAVKPVYAKIVKFEPDYKFIKEALSDFPDLKL